MSKLCVIGNVVNHCAAALEGVWLRLKWIGRILRSIATGAEASKKYPDRAIELLWTRLPCTARSWKGTQAIGRLVHQRVRKVQERSGSNCTANFTRFFRNLPQLELLRDLGLETHRGVPLKLAVLGCSTGAELYSALWVMRTARPEQEIQALGVDISETAIHAAVSGVYPLQATEIAGISATTYERLFSRERDTLRVQNWLRQGIRWWVGDVCSSDLAAHFGLHDVVFANNFLFHMSPERAKDCLRNIARLVAPKGYLFVGGVDLDVRSATLLGLGFTPVTERLEDIYTAEEGLLTAWPLQFWGLEPIDRRRQNWPARYTTVFRSPDGVRCGRPPSRRHFHQG